MKNHIVILLLLLIAFGQISASANSDAVLEDLYQNRQYFDLRDELAKHAKENSPILSFYRGVAANRFNDLKASDKFIRGFLKSSDKDQTKIREANEILADNYVKQFEYGKAADVYKYLLENFRDKIPAEDRTSYENVFALWNSLRNSPKQIVSLKGDSEIQGSRDKAKMLNLPVEINNQKIDFVFDTGANVSTITVSTAQKLGLQIIESDFSVGSSTDKRVKSKLAIAPDFKIGNARFRNVLFLVFDDKSLFFPQINYQINGIIGFPVISSLKKLSLSQKDLIKISDSKAGKVEPNMCLVGLMPMVAAHYNNQRLIFAFDTGAGSSMFYQKFFKRNEEEITRLYKSEKIKFGGAGGSQEADGYNLKNLNLSIGGKNFNFKQIRLVKDAFNEDSKYVFGNLGQDLIKQFETMTLDFKAMRIEFN